VLVGSLMLLFTACDQTRLFEEYKTINNYKWHYQDTVKFEFTVEDTTTAYDIMFNLRHKGNYPYRNIWVQLIREAPNEGVSKLKKKEFKLAEKDGRWTGNGMGDIYDHRFRVKQNFRFGRKGTYEFKMVHLMREDNLKGIMDVGLRISKSAQL